MNSVFDKLRHSLSGPDLPARLHDSIIGHDAQVPGPNGPNPMVYADYVASGRALRQIEDLVLTDLLPLYANSHTEASYTGAAMTSLRREARQVIADLCGASDEHAVIFAGPGATQGLNRLVHLLDVGPATRVLVGPYEHHSNLLPWRESGAEVIELPEGPDGGPDPSALAVGLTTDKPVVVALSAASNVTGLMTDVAAITKQVKTAGGRIVWDFAGGGPYLPIDMGLGMDAVVVSPHKFVGGPQASGVLILRRDAVKTETPTLSGGGTVRFVSSEGHDYLSSLEAREEAGTPNVIGDLRAAMVFVVKDCLGQDMITSRNAENARKAMEKLANCPTIDLLGPKGPRLPILSFRIKDGKGGYVHQQQVTQMLSERYGIQARGGCACAGPYVIRLLEIDATEANRLRHEIACGRETEKPGFTRLNLSYLMPDAEVDFILNSVIDLALSFASGSSDSPPADAPTSKRLWALPWRQRSGQKHQWSSPIRWPWSPNPTPRP